MDDMQDEARFPPKSHSQNRSRRVPLYSLPAPSNFNPDYLVDGNDEFDDDEFDEQNNHQFDGNYTSRRHLHDLNEQTNNFDRYPKRQKLKNLVLNYEFVSRSSNSMPPDWTEHEKFVLLEVWGDRFLQLGRNSLRSEDWVLVAEKVSEVLKMDRTEVQCKQMMDLLKRRYRKERAKGGGGGGKWAYFRKMDMLMSREFGTSANEFCLACGVDSGEFVFMDTDVYLERANVNDEMRDSPCDSEEEEEEEEGGSGGKEGVKGLRVLADSVKKFGKIYEKIESSKREQMLELEKMRSEFQRELELQKKQILERAQVEIAKIREVNDDDDDEDEDEDDDEDSDEDDDDNVSE